MIILVTLLEGRQRTTTHDHTIHPAVTKISITYFYIIHREIGFTYSDRRVDGLIGRGNNTINLHAGHGRVYIIKQRRIRV